MRPDITDPELIMSYRRQFYEETEKENKISPAPFWVCHLSMTNQGVEYVFMQQAHSFQEASELFWSHRMRLHRDLIIYSEILAK